MVQECWTKRWSLGGLLCMSMIWDIHPPKLKKISNVFIWTSIIASKIWNASTFRNPCRNLCQHCRIRRKWISHRYQHTLNHKDIEHLHSFKEISDSFCSKEIANSAWKWPLQLKLFQNSMKTMNLKSFDQEKLVSKSMQPGLLLQILLKGF